MEETALDPLLASKEWMGSTGVCRGGGRGASLAASPAQAGHAVCPWDLGGPKMHLSAPEEHAPRAGRCGSGHIKHVPKVKTLPKSGNHSPRAPSLGTVDLWGWIILRRWGGGGAVLCAPLACAWGQ